MDVGTTRGNDMRNSTRVARMLLGLAKLSDRSMAEYFVRLAGDVTIGDDDKKQAKAVVAVINTMWRELNRDEAAINAAYQSDVLQQCKSGVIDLDDIYVQAVRSVTQQGKFRSKYERSKWQHSPQGVVSVRLAIDAMYDRLHYIVGHVNFTSRVLRGVMYKKLGINEMKFADFEKWMRRAARGEVLRFQSVPEDRDYWGDSKRVRYQVEPVDDNEILPEASSKSRKLTAKVRCAAFARIARRLVNAGDSITASKLVMLK